MDAIAELASEKPYFSFDYIKTNDGSNMHGAKSVDDLDFDLDLLEGSQMDENLQEVFDKRADTKSYLIAEQEKAD